MTQQREVTIVLEFAEGVDSETIREYMIRFKDKAEDFALYYPHSKLMVLGKDTSDILEDTWVT